MLAATGTVPTYFPVTTPLADTVAKLESALTQSTLRPASTLPAASFAAAVSDTVPPRTTVADGGATSTVATASPLGSSASSRHAAPDIAAAATATAHHFQVARGDPICRHILHESNRSLGRQNRVGWIVRRLTGCATISASG